LLRQALIQESGMKTRPTRPATSIAIGQRRPLGIWMTACLAIVLNSMPGSWMAAQAAPPTPADDIDYAASGFRLPPGVNPTTWATAAGVSAAGGMNYASQPAISGPMMAPPMMMNGMPGNGPVMPRMGPNGPTMGRPGMEGPMMGPSQMPGASSIPSTFPSGPVPGMGGVVPTGLQAPLGPNAYQAAMTAPYGQNPYGVMPVGFCGQSSSCDGMCGDPGCGAYASGGYSSCDCAGGCDSGCGGGGRKFNGLLSMFSKKCNQCNGYGCKSCAQKSLQNDCIGHGGLFGDLVNGSCLDGDLGLMLGGIGSNLSMLSECLSPYAEAGKCSQRWFDFSAEYMALSSNLSQPGAGVVTTRGIAGVPVLSVGDADSSGLASGVRLSAAMILGVGGNIEATYMGGHEWSDSATATGAEDLFSFISATS
ncbi:unnamed protein product, partial [Hapterophycus canaliculatus]